jgi:hypothetical protein
MRNLSCCSILQREISGADHESIWVKKPAAARRSRQLASVELPLHRSTGITTASYLDSRHRGKAHAQSNSPAHRRNLSRHAGGWDHPPEFRERQHQLVGHRSKQHDIAAGGRPVHSATHRPGHDVCQRGSLRDPGDSTHLAHPSFGNLEAVANDGRRARKVRLGRPTRFPLDRGSPGPRAGPSRVP